MADGSLPTLPVRIAGRTFRALDLDDPKVVSRITGEMRSGVDVYYDRRWGLTRAFCSYLLERPELVRGRRVLAAGAGVGLEAVVLGSLADGIVVNDRAPVSLELAAHQLRANGIHGFEIDAGLFQDADLEDIDLVVACFVVYDEDTRDGMARLLERCARRSIPALLANEDIGGFFDGLLEQVGAPVEELARVERGGRIVGVG